MDFETNKQNLWILGGPLPVQPVHNSPQVPRFGSLMCQEAEPPQGHPSTAGTPCRSMTSPKGTPSTESLHDVQDTSQELHQDSAPKSGIWRLQGAAPPRVDSADTLWKFEIAIENTPFSSLIYLFKMVIFYSYVSLPEGNFQLFLWSSPNMHLQERLASQQSVPRNVKPFVIPNSTEIHTLNIKQTIFFFKLKVHSKHGSSVLKYPSRILGVKASPNFWSPIFKDSRLEPKGHRSPSGHATHVTTPTVAFATLMLPGEAKCCAGWSHQIWVSNLWQLFPKICFQMVFINSRQRCLKYIYVENDHRWW